MSAFNTVGNIVLSGDVMGKKLDEERIRRNIAKYLGRLIAFASGIVEERTRERESEIGKERKDLLDALLDEGEVDEDGLDKLSAKNIAIVILEMFFGGTETTSTTIEWGMAELLRHQSSMEKIQDEIDRVVGRTRRVQEDDLTPMPICRQP
ncbi:cytochrome P450- family 76- subfamily C-polypeptide 6 [Striga hermonthica]|uniref:Cytochrome P450- family 76- subfamily C-polypeptide 6 n=1 Tax=Striga hermonthica TaxID=68872 RepID=A0A9N7R7Q4_STRHE|nr:cytochrome P450- family 76- subfamily C-polypeptide 6 [Striga hermonthica]